MSKMFDVYQNFSDLYDELVNHEDYESNLYKFLNSKIQWENKVVGEFGIGTGRVTKNYIDKAQKLYAYDNSQHMIDKAKENLSKWADKIEYEVLDNSKINSIETLGTNVELPNPPGEKLSQFYHALVEAGFKEHIIQTDYKFSNCEEAGNIMGAFFGDSMKNDIIQKQLNVIKEFTGIWIYREAY